MATIVTAKRKDGTTNIIRVGNIVFLHNKDTNSKSKEKKDTTIRIAVTKTDYGETRNLYF